MGDIDESNDLLWIDEALQGRMRSFSNLILKYQDRIYTFVVRSITNREDAEDITQNVFIGAFSNLKKFRKECSFKTWLYRIAANRIKNYWRDKKNRFVIAESELASIIEEYGNRTGEISDASNETESEDLKQIVANLIASLPLELRQIFVLYYVTGCTCQQIAEIFKTSASNIKIQLFRGRKYLFDRFK